MHGALLRAKVATAPKLAALADHEGTVMGLLESSLDQRLFSPEERPAGTVLVEDIDRACREVAEWNRDGLRAVTVLSPEYPTNLHSVFDRPPFLFIRGEYRYTDWGSGGREFKSPRPDY